MMRNRIGQGMAALLLAALSLAAPGASDEQKKHAYEVIDRNAAATAMVGDSLFYYGELGMQEHESAKFLKQTLELRVAMEANKVRVSGGPGPIGMAKLLRFFQRG